MQLLSDAVVVLGSRHGLLLSPHARQVQLVRFDRFDEAVPFGLRAGLRVGGREVVFPLCPDGELFRLIDQRMTPCSSVMIGLDPISGLKVKLRIVTPFRPRDADFSTIPAIGIELSLAVIEGKFRWENPVERLPAEAELFVEVVGGPFRQVATSHSLDLFFEAVRRAATDPRDRHIRPPPQPCPQQDRLVAIHGKRQGPRFTLQVSPDSFEAAGTLRLAWCTWSEPILQVQGQRCPFRYARHFPNLDAVSAWVQASGDELFANAGRVDAIVARAEVGAATHHLLAQTLHSWLACTWWVDCPEREWFSVWEGNCYFHSTVDVEFTQAPFYLAVWPELLGLELDAWPEFSRDGGQLFGPAGAGTRFLCHDCGSYAVADGQSYPHGMEVEETANYILMVFAYARRTGDLALPARHADTIRAYLRFLTACDTSGNGVPDVGVANTIDDASPAIQYGKQQTYLAVKTLAALETGAELVLAWGDLPLASACREHAARLRLTIDAHGWNHDHFTVLLEKGGTLRNPWTGQQVHWDEIPGWDAPHIYTANSLPILDMVGFDLGLDPNRVRQDLIVSTRRCLREYGCVHTDFDRGALIELTQHTELVGASRNPGWIAMNLLRDLAAIYRGLDFRHLAERYWDWQTLTNSREACLFFETFGGNSLQFYPRGVVVWGICDALGGIIIDAVNRRNSASPRFPGTRVPRFFTADWARGTVEVIDAS